ncbi:MAG: hypothetical protein NTY98_02850 [Verrucomicrobia bacterium]|nr:hypothetical protein [Verrucomicrobiota bacterium]
MKSLRHILPALLLLMPCLHSLALDAGSEFPNPVIPVLAINNATITDAVRFTLSEARKIDPRATATNVIVNEIPTSESRVTLELKKAPLLSALHMMAETCFYTLTLKDNTIQLRSKLHGAKELLSVVVHLSPETLRQLNIDKLDEDSAKRALQILKIDLHEIDKIIPMPEDSRLFIQGREPKLEKVKSIIELLNRGLKIEK